MFGTIDLVAGSAMIIYSGANEHLFHVGRIDAGRSQIVAAGFKAIYVWDVRQPDKPVQSLPIEIHGSNELRLLTSPDGQWIVGCGHHKMRCWKAGPRGWKPRRTGSGTVCCAARFTAAPSTLTLVTLDGATSGQVRATCIDRNLAVTEPWSAAFSVVAAFSLAPCALPSARDFYRLPWYATDLSRDGKWFLMSPREKAVHIWHTPDHRYVGVVRLKGISNEAVLSPDGSMFAIDCGTTIYIHRTEDLAPIATWRIKYDYVPSLAWSPDGRRLARTDNSATVRVFDVAARCEVTALRVPRQRGIAVAFSPDGLTMLVGTTRGAVIVWDVDY
jgi:WD40 repeat protein